MIASACMAGDRQKLHACSCKLYGTHGKKSPREAKERRRSQGLIINDQTTVFHPLDFLREDGGELQPKGLCQLRHRCPHSAAQFRYNKFLRWFRHGKGSFGSGVDRNSRHWCAHYTRLREARGENSCDQEGYEEGQHITEMRRPAHLQTCNLLPLRRTPPKPTSESSQWEGQRVVYLAAAGKYLRLPFRPL